MDSKILDMAFEEYKDAVVEFAQGLVRIKSISDHEGDIAHYVKARMEALGYDQVFIDSVGNVVGIIGNGPVKILFDSHMDAVEVFDEDEWKHDPYGGEIVDGKMYGRGSVDMKSALASSVYAGALVKKLGLQEGKTVYVVGSVNEEFCDGENLRSLFDEKDLKPDYCIICEPSDSKLLIGHKGKVQARIIAHGISSHGAEPYDGRNAVYEMAEIIQRVQKHADMLDHMSEDPKLRGALSLTDISCTTASINAVPNECAIYLDRRTIEGESEEDVFKELDSFVEGKDADWEIGTINTKSWTGKDICYRPVHKAWRIGMDEPLTQAGIRAYETVFGHKPESYAYSLGSSNAVTPVSRGIPTIDYGPGDGITAHRVDEFIEVKQIVDAVRFYAAYVSELS